jgi:hypothetical protein
MATVGQSISDLQTTIEAALAALSRFDGALLPSALVGLMDLAARPNMVPRVYLCKPDGRRIRKTADASYFQAAAGCKVEIVYEPVGGSEHQQSRDIPQRTEEQARSSPVNGNVEPTSSTSPNANESRETEDRIQQLVVTLASAERDQRWFKSFVALTTFRDKYLPSQGYEWAQAPGERQSLLAHAIERGLIHTSRVANPKSPEHPVTAIRLNRTDPAVQCALKSANVQPSPFAPVPIRGEPLSDTVIRERR